MGRRAKRKTVKLNRKFLYLALAFVCLFATLYVSFSKYVIKVGDYHAIESEEFYFSSDVLVNSDEETKIYEIYAWEGTGTYTVPIILKNYDDELKYTASNIEYKINIINGTETKEYTAGTITGGSCVDETVNVEVTNIDINNSEFTIEVISNSPYTKTLSATFRLYTDKLYKEYIENEQNVILNINPYVNTTITITYDNTKYILDNSQNIFDNQTITTNDTKNSVTLNIGKGESYNIIFIKVNSAVIFDENVDIEIH